MTTKKQHLSQNKTKQKTKQTKKHKQMKKQNNKNPAYYKGYTTHNNLRLRDTYQELCTSFMFCFVFM